MPLKKYLLWELRLFSLIWISFLIVGLPTLVLWIVHWKFNWFDFSIADFSLIIGIWLIGYLIYQLRIRFQTK